MLTRIGCHCTGEVVGLCSEEEVPVTILRLEGGGGTWLDREHGLNLEPSDGRRVILEGNHAVVGVDLPWLLDELEEAGGHLLAVDHNVAAKKPVARVLAVGLRDVKELDVSGIALHIVLEEVRIVVEVPIVKGEAHLLHSDRKEVRGAGGMGDDAIEDKRNQLRFQFRSPRILST